MTCRHSAGDMSCSSHPYNVEQRQYERETERERKRVTEETLRAQLAKLEAELRETRAVTPDAEKFEVLDAVEVGPHLAMRIKYPNCAKCSFEGVKVMVFPNVGLAHAIKWRRIDPHFRDVKLVKPTEAPAPIARYPGDATGWLEALDYARRRLPK